MFNAILRADDPKPEEKKEDKPPLPVRVPNPPTTGGERHPLWS